MVEFQSGCQKIIDGGGKRAFFRFFFQNTHPPTFLKPHTHNHPPGGEGVSPSPKSPKRSKNRPRVTFNGFSSGLLFESSLHPTCSSQPDGVRSSASAPPPKAAAQPGAAPALPNGFIGAFSWTGRDSERLRPGEEPAVAEAEPAAGQGKKKEGQGGAAFAMEIRALLIYFR